MLVPITVQTDDLSTNTRFYEQAIGLPDDPDIDLGSEILTARTVGPILIVAGPDSALREVSRLRASSSSTTCRPQSSRPWPTARRSPKNRPASAADSSPTFATPKGRSSNTSRPDPREPEWLRVLVTGVPRSLQVQGTQSEHSALRGLLIRRVVLERDSQADAVIHDPTVLDRQVLT